MDGTHDEGETSLSRGSATLLEIAVERRAGAIEFLTNHVDQVGTTFHFGVAKLLQPPAGVGQSFGAEAGG